MDVERPRVFISYAHENAAHRAAVRTLAGLLRSRGLDVRLDQYVEDDVSEWPSWAEQEIRSADFIVVVASPGYRQRAGTTGGAGSRGRGVDWELPMIKELVYSDRQRYRSRVISTVLPGTSPEDIPFFLGPAGGHRVTIDSLSPAGIDELSRRLSRPPPGPPVDRGERASPVPHRARRRWYAAAAVAAVLVLAVYAVIRSAGGGAPPLSGCAITSGGAGLSQPAPSSDRDLTFCPVRINQGLPITGRFRVEGQVLGPLADRRKLLLAVMPDPATCDANGRRPTGNHFVPGQVDIATPDGRWSYVDDLGGFEQGVTLGRTYEYVSGPAEALAAMRRDHTDAGIRELPPGTSIVARFYVGAGTYRGTTVPCHD